jgi:hypothetical protein
MIELMTNYDFFRGRPIEGLRETSLKPEDRTGGASTAATLIGRDLGLTWLTGATGQAVGLETAVSPVQLEHLMQGYGGIAWGLFSTAFTLAAADLDFFGLPNLAAKQVHSPFGETPIVSPALQEALGWAYKDADLQSTRFVDEYYRAGDAITQVVRSAREARRGGDLEYARENVPAGAEAAYKLVNKARRKMGELNTAVRTIENHRTMSRAEKEAKLVPLQRARNQLARQVVETVRKIEERQGKTFAAAAIE